MLSGKNKLEGVDQRLVDIVEEVGKTRNIIVTEGVRTLERQKELYAQGRTKPGKMITWTLKSKHIDGKAVDVCPYVNKTIPWNDTIAFVDLGIEMLDVAHKKGISIRWGYDWDGDESLMEAGESDGPHFELRE